MEKQKIFRTIEEAQAAGYTIQLSKEQAEEIEIISDEQRIKLLAIKTAINKSMKLARTQKKKLKAARKDERSRRRKNR